MAVDGGLHPRVAAAEHFGQKKRDDADHETADGRFHRLGHIEASEEPVAGTIKKQDVRKSDNRAEHAEHRVEGELSGSRQGKLRDIEDGRGAVMKREDHESDNRRKDAGNDGLELEILSSVQDLRCEERGPQRGLKDGAYPSGGPCEHHDPPFPIAYFKDRGKERAESGAYLRDRSFLARRSSRPYGNRRCNSLNYRHPTPDHSFLSVKAVDHGVGPMTLGFRGEIEYDKAGDESPQSGNPQHHPPGEWNAEEGVARGAPQDHDDQIMSEESRSDAQKEVEDNGAKTRDDAYQDAHQGPAPDAPHSSERERYVKVESCHSSMGYAKRIRKRGAMPQPGWAAIRYCTGTK